MVESRKIKIEKVLHKIWVGPINAGDDLVLYRAPVVQDGGGTYKRLPHQVKWEHLQVDDIVIACGTHEGPSGQSVLDTLQVWRVLKIEDESFQVEIHNIVGMGAYGNHVYNNMAAMVGSQPTDL